MPMDSKDLDDKPVNTVEDALKKLGGFSYFQIWVAFVILIAEIPTSAITLSLIFTGTGNVEFLCVTNNTAVIMSTKDPNFCNRNCTLVPDPRKPVISIVQEWELVCDKAWISDLFTSIQMGGMMVGAFTASQLCDALGRKKIFYCVIVTMGVFGMTSGLVNSYYLFALFRFLTGVGLGGFYATYFIYLMEFLTPSWRTIAGCISLWSVGVMNLALLAYLIPSWRYLTCATSSMAIVMLIFYPFMSETPRWLLCKERTSEAELNFQKIAKMNRKPMLASSVVISLQKSVLNERSNENQSQSVWEIYRNPELRYRILIFLFGWFTVSTIYYSMSFNAKNLSGDPHLNVLYMALVDFPAFPSGVLFNNWLGRRKSYAGYLIFASVSLVALVITENFAGHVVNPQILLGLGYLGRFGIGGAWGVVSCFTAESFPTVCRSSALGVCTLAAYIGGILAPQLVYLGSISPSTPHYIYAALALIAACSTYLMKETNRKPLENFVSS